MHLMAAIPSYCKSGNHGSSQGRGADCAATSRGNSSSGDSSGNSCRGNSSSGSSCVAPDNFGLLEIDENDNSFPWGLIHHNELAHMLNSGLAKTMVIDSRSFLEYNTSNIQQSVNVCCSKLVKRRLQQDKVHVLDLLNQTCNIGADTSWDVIVYDQCTEDPSQLTSDNFVAVLLHKLSTTFNSVAFLKGGFLAFQASHPSLTENKSSSHRCSTLTSLSQPCMPVSNVGPTRILPFLYLGSQQDSLNQDLAQVNGITYVLNVSKTCPRPPFILDGHFHRIPVNDNYCEKLLPFFQEAFQFLDKVREANGCVLVHCLGGVSRSATLAIAYIMRYFRMSSDEAYRYVKDKRPTISPNFNFLGQLLEYEKILRQEEQDEDARKKMLRIEEKMSRELDRANPAVMDLHTSSPSSPCPRRPQRPFVMEFSVPVFEPHVSSSLRAATLAQPMEEASRMVGVAVEDSVSHIHSGMSDLLHFPGPSLCPFPGPSSESCPFPGPSLELCPFPGPSLESCPFSGPLLSSLPELVQSPVEPQPACLSAVYRSHKTDTTLKTAHDSRDLRMCQLDTTSFCDNTKQDAHPVIAQSPLCPVTGFPSPASVMGDFPQSTCPRTGFPGPGNYGSSNNSTVTQQTQLPTSNSSALSHQTETETRKTDTQTLFKTCVTYHNLAESRSLSAAHGPDSGHDLFPRSLQKEPTRPRTGFSLSSMFSSLRWKTRPPTLSLGSPTGTVKEKSRHSKKHPVETIGVGDGRVQLTPVSEAGESIDLVTCDVSSEGMSASMPVTDCWHPENLDQSEINLLQHVSLPGSSSLSNATTIAMASTQSHLSSAAVSSSTSSHTHGVVVTSSLSHSHGMLVTSSHSHNVVVTSTSCASINVLKPVRPTSSKFALTLSSPNSEFPSAATNGTLFSLPSPGDSNKRKSFPPLSSDSPDKLAKTEESLHLHVLSPPKTLNLLQGISGKPRPRIYGRRPFILPISSPTADMARLKVTSPSDPPLGAAVNDEIVLLGDGQRAWHSSCSDLDRKASHSHLEALTSGMIFMSSDPRGISAIKTPVPCGFTKCRSGRGLSSSSTCLTRSTLVEDKVLLTKVDTFQQQHPDTSSSSPLSAMSLSSFSSLSKSCTSIYSPSVTPSTLASINSSISLSTSHSVNLQGFSQFPTTSLDKLSFTPCYTKDIIQDLKSQELEQLTCVEQGTSPSDGNLGPSVLDSPMSISSGSSGPSLASSTLSPVESSLANVFSDNGFHTATSNHSAEAFQFATSLHDSTVTASFGSSQHSPKSACSATSSDLFILSPLLMPQSTVAPTTPTMYSSYSYCSSVSAEPLSPMSLSDSASSSPLRSPTRTGINSPLHSSLSTPGSSLSSPVVSSPPFSPLISSLISSTSSVAGTSASPAPKVVLRRDKNKRVMDRPNSIAFSSYPACDLVPDNSASQAAHSSASLDDSSEAYMSGQSKRSRRSNQSESDTPLGRTPWGRHSEREVYKQITAAMENAMLRTQVFSSASAGGRKLISGNISSRKARSLDDIVDGSVDEDDFTPSHSSSGTWSRCTEHSLFEKYRCGLQNVSEPYHSSSSLSSNGSHSSSMEIQLPR